MMQQSHIRKLVAEQRDTIMAMRRARDQAGLQTLQEKLIERTEAGSSYARTRYPYTPAA